MTNKLYVGNIPYTLDGDELGKLFEEYGTVESAVVISDRQTGRSRGFGFVEMSSGEEAQTAMEGMNGASVGGRNVVVNEAHGRRQAGGRRPPREHKDEHVD